MSPSPAPRLAAADEGGGLGAAIVAQVAVMAALALYVAWPALRRLRDTFGSR